MPFKLDKCVKKVELKVRKGKLPKGSNPFTICVSSIQKSKKK